MVREFTEFIRPSTGVGAAAPGGRWQNVENNEDKGLKAGFHTHGPDEDAHWTRRGNEHTVHVYDPKDPEPWPIGTGPDKWMPNKKDE